MGPTALRPIRRTKQWLGVLLKDTSVTAGESNPHSADQKHQSLNSVLLTALFPQYFVLHLTVYFWSVFKDNMVSNRKPVKCSLKTKQKGQSSSYTGWLTSFSKFAFVNSSELSKAVVAANLTPLLNWQKKNKKKSMKTENSIIILILVFTHTPMCVSTVYSVLKVL